MKELRSFVWAKPPPFMYYWRELIELWYSNKWFYKYLSGANFPLWEMQSSRGWSQDLFLGSSKVSPAGCSVVAAVTYRGAGRSVQAVITNLQWALRISDKSQLLNTHWCAHKEDKCACQAETRALHTRFLLSHRTCRWSTQASVISCFPWVAGGCSTSVHSPRGPGQVCCGSSCLIYLCLCSSVQPCVSSCPLLARAELSEILALFGYLKYFHLVKRVCGFARLRHS